MPRGLIFYYYFLKQVLEKKERSINEKESPYTKKEEQAVKRRLREVGYV